MTGTLDPTASGTLSNTATISVPASNVDLDPTNNSSTDTRTINPEADLSVTNVAGASSVFAGDTLTYTLTVGLQGQLDRRTSAPTDVLPDGTTFVSLTAPAGWTVTGPAVGGTGTVTATLDTLPQGAAPQVFTLVVQVASDVAAGTVLTNSATVNSAAADSDLTNNTADAVTTVTPHLRPAVTGSGPGGALLSTCSTSPPARCGSASRPTPRISPGACGSRLVT